MTDPSLDREAIPATVSPPSVPAAPDGAAPLRNLTAREVMEATGGTLKGTLIERIGMEFLEAGPRKVVARIPVAGNTQPYGFLHGGATAALCETVASLGTGIAVGPEQAVLGLELNVNHIRSVREGHVTATGVALHIGRTTAVWDIAVRDDEGRLVAASRLTLAIRATGE